MSAENRQKTAMREGIRYSVVFAAMLLLLAVLVVWNINSGSVPLTVPQVAEILLGAGREETQVSSYGRSVFQGSVRQ